MGLWFLISVIVVGNLLYKAYKLRITHGSSSRDHERITQLLAEVEALKKERQEDRHEARLRALEETVFFGDFELKQQFKQLEQETLRKSQS